MVARLRHPAAAHAASACRAPAARATRSCTAASRASIRTRAPCPTSTRTCSAKARSSARASTTSMRSSARSSDRFPENRILSHDLLEGCYARSGLLSDVQLYEDYPSRYGADVEPPASLDPRRLADRAAGCCRACRRPDGRSEPNPLSRAVAVEDLRQPAPQPRAAGAAAAAAARLAARAAPLAGRSPSLASSLIPPLLRRPRWTLLRKPRDAAAAPAPAPRPCARPARHLAQAAFTLACLPYEAYSAWTRSLRTLWRMLVTRRRLLEWSPSSESSATAPAISPLAAARCGSRPVARRRRGALARGVQPGRAGARRAGPRCCGSPRPRIAWWLSRPLRAPRGAADAGADALPAHGSRARPGPSSRPSSARRTTGCRPTTSRSTRSPCVAHRTSPTNIGLALLANLAAHDFGYLTAGAADRAHRATRSARWQRAGAPPRATSTTGTTRGRCKPLPPRYVSTVDSGNLAGHLLTLRPGLLALADAADPGAALLRGPARHAARCSTTRRRRRLRASRALRRCATRCAIAAGAARERGDVAAQSLDARCGASQRWPARAEDAATPGPLALARQCRRPRARRAARILAVARLAEAHPDACASSAGADDSDVGDRARDGASAPRASRLERLAREARRVRAHGVRVPRTTRRATCWRSATTSPSAGATRATTTCSPRKRALAQLRRDRAGPAAAGELVRARPPADRPPAASRCCCRGAARCSST